jgi:hypothetical protein
MSTHQAETPARFGKWPLLWQRSSTKRPPRLLHLFYRFQPGALFGIAVALVALLVGLDFAPEVHDWLDRLARKHEVGISLSEHLLVAGLVAAAAYWWLLGHKRQQALKSYRRRACESPEELVEWSRGKPVVRDSICKLLADGIRRSNETVVAIVQGRAGTGRTGFIVGLVRELAERDLIPVPVFAKREGSFALEELARETFFRHIDQVLSSEQQADAIWHRARATRDIVVLVDGLDDEVREALWRDDGQPFEQAVQSLRSRHIALVLATPGDLPRLDEMRPIREDLDVFNRDEAEGYLRIALDHDNDAADVTVQALRRHSDPVDGGLIAPFYLDLLVRMAKSGIDLQGLFTDRDRWRSEVLERYLGAIGAGGNLRIVPESSADAEAPDPQTRALDAKDAAQRVADELIKGLAVGQPELTVARNRLETRDRALFDAYDLHLLWRGNEGVGFVGDDLGSYLVAARQSDFSKLLAGVGVVADSIEKHERRDRHVLVALIFWHLQRPSEAQDAFEQFLGTLLEKPWTRPAVVAAAIRTASACRLAGCSARVAEATLRCIESLQPGASPTPPPWHASELPKVVRALSQWQDPAAHGLLWEVAMRQKIEFDWAAAKALASEDGAAASLEELIEDTLRSANDYSPEELSDPDHDVGSRIGRLAWFLPALRGELEGKLATVKTFCLEPWMSPLRGEMSLAQGLKLAILKGKEVEENVREVEELLSGSPRPIRFWHARLVLVQALAAYAWKQAEVGDQAEADRVNETDRVKGQLRELLGYDGDPLVRSAVKRVHALLARIPKERAWVRRMENRLGRFLGRQRHPLVRSALERLLALLARIADRDWVRGMENRLGRFLGRERHPLVRRGIALALAGLGTLDSQPTPHWSKYLWEHERDAVFWVEQGKEELAPLAADVVLLSNMTYRRRERKAPADDVNAAAESEKLPRCILRSSARGRIEGACECGLELCTKEDAGNRNVPAVLATRAKFSENFCREQARLVAQNGPPQWTKREIRLRTRRDLQTFWDGQARGIADWKE